VEMTLEPVKSAEFLCNIAQCLTLNTDTYQTGMSGGRDDKNLSHRNQDVKRAETCNPINLGGEGTGLVKKTGALFSLPEPNY